MNVRTCAAPVVLLRSLACISLLGAHPATAPPNISPTVTRLELRLDKGVWGEDDPDDVKAVLRSTGRELLRYFPGRTLPAIHVKRGGPITLFDRERDGTIVMKIDAQDSYWSQYAYQFGHELCHVLCRYREAETGNKWFEESLCETASLFVLRRMAESWKTDPPYANWKGYAPSLAGYAEKRIEKFRLPEGQTLADWYPKHVDALRKTGEDRG